MGEGQEAHASRELEKASENGSWVMLQNIHLMTAWCYNVLERMLEVVCLNPHKDFRVILSSEAPPLPLQKIIPESILQNAIKVSNESPTDLKSNLRRA